MCTLTKVKRLSRFQTEKKIIQLMRVYGTPKSRVQQIKEGFREAKKGITYYYYDGPLDEKTRDFCKLMLKIDKVFSEDDIAIMSIELGYDVIKYKGSYNCRHKWVRFRGEEISTPPPTINQIRSLINKGITS